MDATQFDYAVDVETDLGLTLPEAYDEWPVGDGSGTVNRRQDGRPGHVVLDVRVTPNGYVVVEEMPDRDEDTGGLEGRFGDWTPADLNSGPMADYKPDVRDQLANNPLGQGGPYEVYGRTVGKADMAGGTWPADPDLSAAQVREWARCRGDDHLAGIIDQLASEGL